MKVLKEQHGARFTGHQIETLPAGLVIEARLNPRPPATRTWRQRRAVRLWRRALRRLAATGVEHVVRLTLDINGRKPFTTSKKGVARFEVAEVEQ